MDMVSIAKCSMVDCAYNKNRECHTPAITVGDHAECNTYVHASARGGYKDVTGAVGACRAMDCRYNDALECHAAAIDVADHDKHADCATFAKKASASANADYSKHSTCG